MILGNKPPPTAPTNTAATSVNYDFIRISINYQSTLAIISIITINRPQMVAKLLINLEQGMQKGLINNQSSGVTACAEQIIQLAGLATDSQYNSRGRRTFG